MSEDKTGKIVNSMLLQSFQICSNHSAMCLRLREPLITIKLDLEDLNQIQIHSKVCLKPVGISVLLLSLLSLH